MQWQIAIFPIVAVKATMGEEKATRQAERQIAIFPIVAVKEASLLFAVPAGTTP
jgi:hypothetical protein